MICVTNPCASLPHPGEKIPIESGRNEVVAAAMRSEGLIQHRASCGTPRQQHHLYRDSTEQFGGIHVSLVTDPI